MAYGILNQTTVFLKQESTEGVAVAPASASDALEVAKSGYQFNYTREDIEIKTIDGTREPKQTRQGLPTVSGTLEVYNRAAALAGGTPPAGLLFQGLLGATRSISTQTTTKATGNTVSTLAIQDADISKFHVGDIVKIVNPGNHEVRPISAIVTTAGSATISFPFPLVNIPPASVVIEKSCMYYVGDPQPTMTLTEYLGGSIQDVIAGLRPVSASLKGWDTGKVSTWDFKVDGLSFAKTVATPAYTPNFSSLAPSPVMLSASLWLGSVAIPYNALGLAIANTKTDILSASAAQGKIASRFSDLKVSGDVSPYMDMAAIDRFTTFNTNASTSLFGYAYNPTSVAGEFANVVAFWLPQIKITEMPTGNISDVLVDSIKFEAFKSAGNDTVFLGFI